MKKREWFSLFILVLTVAAAIQIGIRTIYITGVDGIRLMQPETKSMLTEAAVLFAAVFVSLYFVKQTKIRFGLLLVVASVFTWLHQAFLPMVVEQIRTQFDCKDVYTSVDEENLHALHLYTSFGFERTEEMDAEERVYVLRG